MHITAEKAHVGQRQQICSHGVHKGDIWNAGTVIITYSIIRRSDSSFISSGTVSMLWGQRKNVIQFLNSGSGMLYSASLSPCGIPLSLDEMMWGSLAAEAKQDSSYQCYIYLNTLFFRKGFICKPIIACAIRGNANYRHFGTLFWKCTDEMNRPNYDYIFTSCVCDSSSTFVHPDTIFTYFLVCFSKKLSVQRVIPYDTLLIMRPVYLYIDAMTENHCRWEWA